MAAGEPTVGALVRYPIKGCAGVPVTEAEMTDTGLAHDRAFLVVGPEGEARTQRADPRLVVVRPEVADDGKRLLLSAPEVAGVEVPVAFEGPRRPASMFGHPMGEFVDQGEQVAEWLSTVLGAPSRLVRMPPGFDRPTSGAHAGRARLGDSQSTLLLSRASLAGLNERIARRGAPPVPMRRFRPNIVVSGWDTPHTEDRAHRLTVGGAELGYAKRAIRCAVTLVDPATGEKAGPEPLRSLAGYRREPGGGVSFGMLAAVLRPGPIRVGDPVRVRAWRDS